MCLIAFSFTPGRPRHLLLAANRDEAHARPARPMTWWSWPDGILAGRDEQAGGTWLAVARSGRWAAVTNIRNPAAFHIQAPGSRGDLPVDFVAGEESPETYVRRVHARRDHYGPFNLLAGDAQSLWYGSSEQSPRAVPPGVHALSNASLDDPWPKSRRVATALRGLAADAEFDPERLFRLMNDRNGAPDAELPDTGVGLELERRLSPPFIVDGHYGTRCTTILALGEGALVAERSFNPKGEAVGELLYQFSMPTT